MKATLGVQVEPQFGFTYPRILEIAQVAEHHNFSHVWLSDHFFMDKNSIQRISLDIWTVMSALAVQTNSIRIGAMVLCNNYRHPAVLAKMVATIDHLSNGRFEFGYGAGWKDFEYNAYGIPFPSAGTRIQQLAEGIEVIKKLWSVDKASYSGKYYNLKEAISYPKPLQQPHPPIWIGTMAAKPKMLKIIAEYAAYANIAWAYDPDQVRELKQKIDSFAKEYGRTEPVKLSLGLWAALYDSEDQFEQAVKKRAEQKKLTFDQAKDQLKGALHGTAEFWIQRLKAYQDVGVDHFVLMFPHEKEIASIIKVNELILPYL